MNTKYRKPLAGTQLEYYDVRQAVEDIQCRRIRKTALHL